MNIIVKLMYISIFLYLTYLYFLYLTVKYSCTKRNKLNYKETSFIYIALMHFVQIMQRFQAIQTKSGYLDVDKQQNGSFSITPAGIELMHSRVCAAYAHEHYDTTFNLVTQLVHT